MNYWIWLSSMIEIENIKKWKLLFYFREPQKIFFAKKEELLKVEGITEKNAEKIIQSKKAILLKQYESYMLKNNIQIITVADDAYPDKLKNIYDPPLVLYGIGDISLLKEKSIAIIGSRNPTLYGIETAKEFSKKLCNNRNCDCKWNGKGN